MACINESLITIINIITLIDCIDVLFTLYSNDIVPIRNRCSFAKGLKFSPVDDFYFTRIARLELDIFQFTSF